MEYRRNKSEAGRTRVARSKCGLARSQRITKTEIFQEVFDRSQSYPGKFMVLRLSMGEDADLRLGVTAGKRSFRRAVDRAKAKRMMREVYRLNRNRLKGKFDIVLTARRGILKASQKELEKELLKLAEKAGVCSRVMNDE